MLNKQREQLFALTLTIHHVGINPEFHIYIAHRLNKWILIELNNKCGKRGDIFPTYDIQ